MNLKIIKEGKAAAGQAGAEELAAINAFAKTELSPEQVYTFSVILCDNEVDRDLERFTIRTLEEFKELFLGKTGICDHEWKSANQKARIYRTELVTDPTRVTAAGEAYCCLKGYAYMLRTEGNAELIAEIEGGIKKETSVGCAVSRMVCSVCGEEAGSCGHVKGETYDGKLCCTLLDGAVDAYEWSFVAVPAQRGAGVTKGCGGPDAATLKAFVESPGGTKFAGEFRELAKAAELGKQYLAELKGEVLRLCLVCDEGMYPVLSKSVDTMDPAALAALKAHYAEKSAALYPPAVQLPGKQEVTRFDGSAFLV